MTLSNRQLALVGLVAFLIFCTLLVPAQLVAGHVLPRGAVQYSGVEGRAFDLTLKNTVWRGNAIGNVRVQPSFWAALTGRFSGQVHISGGVLTSEFSASLGDQLKLSNLSALIDVSSNMGPLLLTGPVSVRSEQLIFAHDGACVEGSALVRTNVLENAFQAMGGQGPLLEGMLACEAGNLQLNLAGENNMASVRLQGGWGLGKTIDVDMLLVPKIEDEFQDSLKTALEFAGLRQTDNGWQGQLTLELF